MSKHRLILSFMIVLGAVLFIRLAHITVVGHDKWDSYAEDMSMRAVYETGPRGDIIDRNGKIIASSRPVYSVNISRADMVSRGVSREDAMHSAVEVMELLKSQNEDITVTMEEVNANLSDKSYMSYMPVSIAEDITAASAKAIQEMEMPGISISVNYIREYPYGDVASHIIGYLGRISEEEKAEYVEEKGYRVDSLIGKSGIEELFEERLRGTDAVSRLQVDSTGKVTGLIDRRDTKKGESVKLTIDMELQQATEKALEDTAKAASSGGTFASRYGDVNMIYAPKTESGAAVVIDVKTGEVLAMASYPDFDPNDFAESISTEKWAGLQAKNPNDPLSPSAMYNIATMSAVQPGSTFKPVTALAALSCGLDENTALYDAGHIDIGGRSFGCHLWNSAGGSHGYVDLDDAMKVSCNYYFYDIASGMDFASGIPLDYEKKITNETVLTFARKLGLGEETGIELAESSGTIPSASLKRQADKAALKNYLVEECETYFEKETIKDSETFERNLEKILNQADKDLTLNQLIGKLKQEDFILEDKVSELAEMCKYTYFAHSGWSIGDTFNIAIGQGDNSYTPLQMASYMATLGNGGVRKNVSLVGDENLLYDDKEGQASPVDTGIDQDDIRTVIDAMACVTSDPGGSLYGLFGSFPYSVAAKTGTAQRAGKIATNDEKDYIRRHLHLIAPDVSYEAAEIEASRLMTEYPDIYDSEVDALRRAVVNLSSSKIAEEDIDRYKESYDNFAWTVALAPADDPEIAVAVLLVQGKTSSNAAPVVREIIGKYGEISQWEKLF